MPRLTPATCPTACAIRRSGPRTQILDVAERLAQTRGFNGFSYADIAAELGITKASLHYHFPSKADLGRALIERYAASFAAALADIARSGEPAPAQLGALRGHLLRGARRAAESACAGCWRPSTRPCRPACRRRFAAFFDVNEQWLSRVLEAGRAARTLAFEGTAERRGARRHRRARRRHAAGSALRRRRPVRDGGRAAAAPVQPIAVSDARVAGDTQLRSIEHAQRQPVEPGRVDHDVHLTALRAGDFEGLVAVLDPDV